MIHWTVAIQRDLIGQEKWAEGNLTNFKDNRQEFLHLDRKKMQQAQPGTVQLGSSFAGWRTSCT